MTGRTPFPEPLGRLAARVTTDTYPFKTPRKPWRYLPEVEGYAITWLTNGKHVEELRYKRTLILDPCRVDWSSASLTPEEAVTGAESKGRPGKFLPFPR